MREQRADGRDILGGVRWAAPHERFYGRPTARPVAKPDERDAHVSVLLCINGLAGRRLDRVSAP
jgi:hypothetical protein